jgi:hypothetical protein
MISIRDMAEELQCTTILTQHRRDRLFEKVSLKTSVEDRGYITQCWIYTGRTSGDGRGGGYGRIDIDGNTVAVHIAMWVNEHGIIPPGKQLDHLCRQRLCWRPSHNELVTNLQNQRRRAAAARENKQ